MAKKAKKKKAKKMKDTNKVVDVEITFTVHRYPKGALFLRNAMADGTIGDDDTRFDVASNINGDSIVVGLGKETFVLGAAELVQKIYGFLQDEK